MIPLWQVKFYVKEVYLQRIIQTRLLSNTDKGKLFFNCHIFRKVMSIFISFLFHSVLSENNLKKIQHGFQKKKGHTLALCSKKINPDNSLLRLHKAQYRNHHYGSERSRDLHTCHLKPTPKHTLDWKTNEPQNMSWNNYDFCSWCGVCFFSLSPSFFFLSFSYAENLGIQNTPKSYM